MRASSSAASAGSAKGRLLGAVVSTSDGTSASWYRRRPERFNDLLRRSIVVHQRLYREWDELAKTYRHALPDVASQEAWEKTFETAKTQT